jgi:hypothetical protein
VIPSTFLLSLSSETFLYKITFARNQSFLSSSQSTLHSFYSPLLQGLRPSDYTFASLFDLQKKQIIMSSIKSVALLALATGFASVVNAAETGKTTRYWDCCKGSCSWPGKAAVSAPITTCDKNDNPLTDANTPSACDGGSAYMCSDQSPWAVSDTLAYGFAAANIAGGSEDSWCCSCYK